VVCRVSGGISTNRAAAVLRRAGSNRCLDDPAWNHVNGTQMQIWGFNGGPNQKWNRG
jgi:alpha-galactosidase